MSSRTEQRSNLDPSVRIQLLEGDVDSVFDSHRELKDAIDGVRKLLTGLLITIVTSSITIVASVLITTGGAS